jgi:hypothetical protein
MRSKLIVAAAFSVALLAAGAASAGEIGVQYLYDLGMSQAAFIKSFGGKSKAKEVQAEVASNPEALAALRAQGVQIKNVILSKPTCDGGVIYYVK